MLAITSLMALVLLSGMCRPNKAAIPPYKDARLSAVQRTEDLLSRMTLDEKLGQLVCPLGWPMCEKVSPDSVTLTDTFRDFAKRQKGGMLWATFRADPWTRRTLSNGLSPRLAAQACNLLQRYAMDSTRLGIPLLLAEEAPHGHMAIGATVFPTSIGLASTWDTDLVERVGAAIGKELRSQGATIGYGPVIDLAREPRWSRVEETYGEDVFLTSEMASAMVRGTSNQGIASTLKHFVAYGIPEGGHNGSPSHVGTRDLEENMLPAFWHALSAGAGSVMTSYNSIDGIPSTCNQKLLTGVLRDRWHFGGVVVSDLESIDGLWKSHHVARDLREAGEMALQAGVDVDLGGHCFALLDSSVKAGRISMETIDRAVRRVLLLKFRSGLFENPYLTGHAADSVRCASHRALAAQAARESVTLLKNDGILPLKPGLRIALVGPNADNTYNQLGDYTAPQDEDAIVTMREGLLALGARITYAKGCAVRDMRGADMAAAVRAARQCDVTVAVVGGSSARDFRTRYEDTGAAVADNGSVSDMEAGEGFDRSTLDLMGRQNELLRALKATGKPLVVVYIEGRPLEKNWADAHANAVLTLWYPGEAGGIALADALLGRCNPAGRLPVSVPASVGQIPVHYNRKLPQPHSYVEQSAAPRYAFGHGLSYTHFSYAALRVEGTVPDGVTAFVEVTNDGPCDGDEVVQLYIHDLVASTVRARMQLCAFRRIHLKAGEKTTVSLPLRREAFELVDEHMRRVVEAGEFELLAGASSADIRQRCVVACRKSSVTP